MPWTEVFYRTAHEKLKFYFVYTSSLSRFRIVRSLRLLKRRYCAAQHTWPTGCLLLRRFCTYLLAIGVGAHGRSWPPPWCPTQWWRPGGWREVGRMTHASVWSQFQTRLADTRRKRWNSIGHIKTNKEMKGKFTNIDSVFTSSSSFLARAAPSFESHPVMRTDFPAEVTLNIYTKFYAKV
jgi:hypothetical protein